MENGTVYWVTGLSGAGKTTIGKLFFGKLKSRKEASIFLDGDELRDVFGNDLGYSREERMQCAMRYSKLCRLLSGQGQDVLICTISMFDYIREWNRANIANYKEIYIKVPMEVLEQRNQKGLYSGNGNDVVGIGLKLELPKNPDIELINDGSLTPDEQAGKLAGIFF